MRSPPPARWTIRPNWTPPRKPESGSKVSSSLPVPTRYLPSTVPPKHSKPRSEEHTSDLQSLMRLSYAVLCLKKKTHPYSPHATHYHRHDTCQERHSRRTSQLFS